MPTSISRARAPRSSVPTGTAIATPSDVKGDDHDHRARCLLPPTPRRIRDVIVQARRGTLTAASRALRAVRRRSHARPGQTPARADRSPGRSIGRRQMRPALLRNTRVPSLLIAINGGIVKLTSLTNDTGDRHVADPAEIGHRRHRPAPGSASPTSRRKPTARSTMPRSP